MSTNYNCIIIQNCKSNPNIKNSSNGNEYDDSYHESSDNSHPK